MNVLYVSHTSVVGGAERSLLELLSGLPGRVSPTVACPAGELAAAVRKLGVPVADIPGTALSFRLHALHTPRGLARLAASAAALRRIVRRARADLVHANSARAGLMAAPAVAAGGPPLVVHLRERLPHSVAGKLTGRALAAGAAMVVANSRYTAASFGALENGSRLRIVYNSVDADWFDPASVDRAAARAALGLNDATYAVGIVGQLTPWKAQDDAIRVLAGLRREAGLNARLFVAGSARFTDDATRFDNRAFERSLHGLAGELKVADAVEFLGELNDVPALMRTFDLLLVPSWEEPFGRVVVEAMAMETVVIATSIGGPAEVIADGEDGVLLPPRDPARWTRAAEQLLSDAGRRARIGRTARRRVTTAFSPRAHVDGVLSGYDDVLAAKR